jgi:hypothetical protein
MCTRICGGRPSLCTVGHNLRVLGDPGEHANQLQRYLAGPMTEVQRLKFMCRAGVFQQGQAQPAQGPLCTERPEETMHHALLACLTFDRAAGGDVGISCAGSPS